MSTGNGMLSRAVDSLSNIRTNGIPKILGALAQDPANFDTVAANTHFTDGGRYWWAGKLYKYGQFKDAVAYVATHALEYAHVDGTTVTNDRAGGGALGRIAAGKATRVHTADYFGFWQVSGPATLATSGADDIAVAESVFCHATTDGTVDGASASTYATGQIGVATEADDNTADTVKVILWLPL